MYAVIQEEAEASKDVILGTISLNDKKPYALFDMSAIHSFVFERYRQLSEIETKPLDTPLHISKPLKDAVLSTLVCKKCKISIGGRD